MAKQQKQQKQQDQQNNKQQQDQQNTGNDYLNQEPGRGPRIKIWHYLAFIGVFIVIQWFFYPKQTNEISYKTFKDTLKSGAIEKVSIGKNEIMGRYQRFDTRGMPQPDTMPKIESIRQKASGGEGYDFVTVRVQDDSLIHQLERYNVNYEGRVENTFWREALGWIIPILFFILIWAFIIRRMSKTMGGGAGGMQNPFNIGKSKAQMHVKSKENDVTFKDVAGVDEAKEELKEMIEFLRTPEKFTRLGGKLPKGVVLIGPPGTGKTLLARAVAGEADVPFFSLTGSEFIEMFVGVGASRVRDLFKQAKSKQPCIIFIDELDAIGKSRGQNVQMGANDERENTLNQLLSEMDGFTANDTIIVMASTNRPEVLDKALLRPGRFDRQVMVDRPDKKGRYDILKLHTKDIKLANEEDLHKIAANTAGFSGADLANICNEAALWASRKDKNEVELSDLQEAIERIVAGLEKKNRLINEKERKIVAYHESGHAIVGHYTPGADPVQKVSIVPRGVAALGFTMQTPLEDRFLMSEKEIRGKIKGLLGGRAAEDLIFGDISTGAANDLEKVTQMAYNMVTLYGMSKKLPNVSFKKQNQNEMLGNQLMVDKRSEKTEQVIDAEAQGIINDCYNETREMLEKHKDKLDQMANRLLENEVLLEDDVTEILGKSLNT
ncbi:MAG: ATP-dependent zinc metalloprotease FtsH [Bacteroidetes bacterium]|jgi:cell division protease FtsH|nr:ATP-dependent zinc metalloprotease FtsH [Bacteroidota bacterium]